MCKLLAAKVSKWVTDLLFYEVSTDLGICLPSSFSFSGWNHHSPPLTINPYPPRPQCSHNLPLQAVATIYFLSCLGSLALLWTVTTCRRARKIRMLVLAHRRRTPVSGPTGTQTSQVCSSFLHTSQSTTVVVPQTAWKSGGKCAWNVCYSWLIYLVWKRYWVLLCPKKLTYHREPIRSDWSNIGKVYYYALVTSRTCFLSLLISGQPTSCIKRTTYQML